MAPFKCPACKTALGSSDSRSIAQHDRQCKSKKKSNSILIRGFKGLGLKLEEARKQRGKRKEKLKEVSMALFFKRFLLLNSILFQPVDATLDMTVDTSPVQQEIQDEFLPEISGMRPRRTLRVPQRLRDLIPTDTGPIRMTQYAQLNLSSRPMRPRTPTPPPVVPEHTPSPSPRQPPSPTLRVTEPDEFGIYREYTEHPTYIPKDIHCENTESARDHRPAHLVFGPRPQSSSHHCAPFANPTVLRLLKWFYDSDKKTLEDLDCLVYDVILQPDFSVSHCEDFSAAKEARRLDRPDVFQSDVWKEDSVEILLPQKDYAWSSEAEAPVAKIDGVWHRSLTEVLTSAFQDASASDFHLKGYKEFWKPPGESQAERIYAEVYTSPEYLIMEEKVRIAQAEVDAQMETTCDMRFIDEATAQPSSPSPSSSKMSVDSCSTSSHGSDDSFSADDACDQSPTPSPSPLNRPKPPPGVAIENVVVPMMLYTDSTHLTNFGSASLWPGYIFFGLLSKYISALAASHSAHHFVYMPEVSTTMRCN